MSTATLPYVRSPFDFEGRQCTLVQFPDLDRDRCWLLDATANGVYLMVNDFTATPQAGNQSFGFECEEPFANETDAINEACRIAARWAAWSRVSARFYGTDEALLLLRDVHVPELMEKYTPGVEALAIEMLDSINVAITRFVEAAGITDPRVCEPIAWDTNWYDEDGNIVNDIEESK